MSEAAVSSGKWSNVPVRIGTALAIAAVVLIFLWLGGWFWAAFAGALAVRMAYEWVRMAELKPHSLALQYLVVVFLAVGGAWVLSLGVEDGLVLPLLVVAVGAIFALMAVRRKFSLWQGLNARHLWLGAAYLSVPLVAMLWLRGFGTGFDTPGARRVLFVILIVVAADAGAYFAGKTIGGPKFIPRLSPNKTWAGFAGGLVAGGLLGGVLAEIWSDDFFEGVLVGLVLVVAAVAGDFLESGFKRHFGVKDTGGILPGHGGVLDRVDSHMAALTVAAVVIALAPGLSPV